jgi:hypothetical protein
MDVEERDEGSACMVGELSEDIGTDGCGRDDEGVRSQGVGLGEPRLYWLVCVSRSLQHGMCVLV